jgi:hypothetical protein
MSRWRATVEYPGAVQSELARSSDATVTTSDGRTTVSFVVEGDTLGLASEAAVRRATGGGAPVSLHVLLLLDDPAPLDPDLVDAAAVRDLLGGVSQQHLTRLQQTPGFPAPVQRFGGGRGLWSKIQIDGYLKRTRG